MGLNVNAEKLIFCTLEIEYLGYILTRDGIKPQSNKVQAILAIQPPTNVKELMHFLGMVQYYRWIIFLDDPYLLSRLLYNFVNKKNCLFFITVASST
jgi:hypothetical protein